MANECTYGRACDSFNVHLFGEQFSIFDFDSTHRDIFIHFFFNFPLFSIFLPFFFHFFHKQFKVRTCVGLV